MNHRYGLRAALIASVGLLAACNQDTAQAPANAAAQTAQAPAPAPADTAAPPAPGTSNETVSAVKDAAASTVGAISAELTTTTNGFTGAAATSDMYEVQAAKIAQMRSKSAAITMFAKMMIADHTKSTNKLKSLIKADRIDVTLPAMLDSRHQGMIDNLSGAKDEDFDARYLNQQVDAHNEAVILFRGYAKDGDNPQLKQFAADTLPVIQMHLDRAKELDKSGADQKSTGSAAPGGVIPGNE